MRAAVIVIALSIVGKCGEALVPALLAREWPLSLLLLNANDFHLVLTSRLCNGVLRVATWFGVSVARRVGEDAVLFWAGRKHGYLAADWLGVNLSHANWWLSRASLCALVLVPGAPVCVVAAIAKVRWTHFLAADTVATFFRAVLLWKTSATLAEPLNALLSWSAEHSSTVLLFSTVFAGLTAWPLVKRIHSVTSRRV